MKITVPTEWKDITLRQYQKLAEVPSLGFDDLDKQLKILEILTGVSDDYFLKVHLTALKGLINKVDFVNNTPSNLRKPSTVKIDGRRFEVNYIPQQLISGEYIDLMELTKTEDKINEGLHKIIPIYLKPIDIFGRKKRGCYEKTQEGQWIQTAKSRKWTEERILDGLTMDKIFPMSGFFLTLWGDLIKATQDYSQKEMEKQMKKVKAIAQDLTNNGAGL
jgi:hypothetical protein